MQFSRRTLVLALGAAVAALYWWTASAVPRAAKPTSGRTIVAFGDSLVEGRGAEALCQGIRRYQRSLKAVTAIASQE